MADTERGGDKQARAITLRNIGGAHLALRRISDAIAAFEAGVELCHAIGDRDGEVVLLGRLAVAHQRAGQRRARRDREQAAGIRRR